MVKFVLEKFEEASHLSIAENCQSNISFVYYQKFKMLSDLEMKEVLKSFSGYKLKH